ncbi:hypothetical protein JUN65_08270 [Gluconacetobacter azotocaptans]|uniref:hypothetical protein n=1 Tax=Gluconacetobacter azotocaptans TaxID=142834 RepID=UPI00195BE458|nr:hypothetical protein [Gluconacetobacter azotocaptans]MBM9401580.1 hypothetical protein [Gluconacetobacter azotocaptans]
MRTWTRITATDRAGETFSGVYNVRRPQEARDRLALDHESQIRGRLTAVRCEELAPGDRECPAHA